MFTIKFFQLFWIFEIFHSMILEKNFFDMARHILQFFWNKVYMSPQVCVLEICNQLILENSRADCSVYGILFSVKKKNAKEQSVLTLWAILIYLMEKTPTARGYRDVFMRWDVFPVASLYKEGPFFLYILSRLALSYTHTLH